ncbi:MAG TPA: NUDIX domain-containing protein [Candidatus Saccharimonadales bacterium]|jgi:isopentenyldiphosphate isomerase|nr:NUDIX domain-containing protein [Candidatus Saccharimonadales bacterium]
MSPQDQPVNQFEVLDDQGHKTGQILGREEVHEQQLWHEVANVWIVNNSGEVLLQLRGPHVDVNPNLWDAAVGTHVRPGEDPTVAAQRCLQTELGLTITPEQLRHLFNIQSANPMADGVFHKVLGHVFLLKRDIDLADCTVDSNKITQLAWRPLMQVMAEVGGSDTADKYLPRAGTYYPQLFEALESEAGIMGL